MNRDEEGALTLLFQEVAVRKGEHPVLITVYDVLRLLLDREPKRAIELVKATRESYPLKKEV